MKFKFYFLTVYLLVSTISYSQLDFPNFGEFSPEEISMKECSFDPEAEAVILLDKAVTGYDEDYRLVTNRRVRIKILNSKGLNRADISIPYFSKDNFEYISNVQAYTYNFGEAGQITSVAVDKKSFFTVKEDNYYSLFKFAMPAVKPGSIIEYHYTSTMNNYGGLDHWYFQSDLPTIKSGYLLEMLPKAEFTSMFRKKRISLSKSSLHPKMA